MKEPLPAEIPDAQPRDSHDAYDVNEVGLQPTIPGIAAAGSQHDEGAMGDEARLEVTNHSRTRTPEQVTLTLPDAPAAAGPDGKRRQRVLRAASDLAPASRAGTESFNSVGRGGQHEDVCMKEPLPAETPDAQPRDSHDAYDVNEVGLQPTIPGIAAAGSQHDEGAMGDEARLEVTNHSRTRTPEQVTLTLPDAPAAAGPDGKRRQRVLRAASDLAPASRAGTESFNSVGRGGQHEDVCMKEPLPAETPDAQPRDSHDAYDVNEVGLQPTIPGIAAAGSQHSHTTLADGVQHQVTNHVHTHTVRQASQCRRLHF